MSSHPDKDFPSSSQFLPPQSAQARGSLFGGPSSDADPPPSSLPRRPRRSLFGGFSSEDASLEPSGQRDLAEQAESDHEEDDFDLILRERPLEAYYGSDSDSYEDSGDEGERNSKKTAKSKRLASEQTPSEPTREEPIYVVHRGVDLPPGTERPNRWDGGPSDYRYAIRPERGVYESLMTSRATDLGAHLYDSFVARQTKPNQKQDDEDYEEEEAEKATRTAKKWMAWPMPAFCVPRIDEHVRSRLDGFNTYRMQPDLRPSAELEEWIIASMTKAAKERFLAREWDNEGLRASREPSLNAMKDDEEAKKDESQEIGSPNPHAFDCPPTIQTDEDILHRQLRPLSRAVISQLDGLLMGLHSSFRHRTKDLDSSDDSATDTDEETSRSRSRSRSQLQKKKQKQSQSRGLKRGREDGREDDSDLASRDQISNLRSSPYVDGFEGDDALEQSHSQSRMKLRERLPLRDWSEVMGIASMMGLPPNAVQRASKRCADLFNEDMTFRTFNEGRIEPLERRADNQWTYGYFESDSEADGQPSKRRIFSRDGSKTSRRSQSQASRLQNRAEMTPPVVAVSPAPPPVRASSVSSNIKAAKPQSGKQPGFGKGPHRKKDIVCPYPDCKRNTDGFSRTWNLNHHIKRAHGGENPPII